MLSRKVVTMLRIKMLYCVSRDSADYISGASSRNLPFLVGAMINEQLNATQNDVGFPYRVSHFSAPHSHHICCLIDLRIEGELCSRALQLEVNWGRRLNVICHSGFFRQCAFSTRAELGRKGNERELASLSIPWLMLHWYPSNAAPAVRKFHMQPIPQYK